MAWKSIEDQRAYFRKRYTDNVAFVRQYKLEKGCADCGYNTHHAGLQFDHLFPRKRGTVASQLGKSRKCVVEEMELCEVVCATCHAIRGFERGQHSKTLLPG